MQFLFLYINELTACQYLQPEDTFSCQKLSSLILLNNQRYSCLDFTLASKIITIM